MLKLYRVAKMLKNGLEITELDSEISIFCLLDKIIKKIGYKKYQLQVLISVKTISLFLILEKEITFTFSAKKLRKITIF
jgi:hypothetical protein